MLFNKSSLLYNRLHPAPSSLMLPICVAYVLLFSGCARSNRITYYDFTGSRLAVDAPVAPPPAIITNSDYDIAGALEGSVKSIFTATTAVVKETQAARARRRIRRAYEDRDVSLLIADGILKRSERYLGFEPVTGDEETDFFLLLNVDRHGIYSGPAYDGRSEFFLDAHVELFDEYAGKTIWKKKVSINEPISERSFFSNIRSSIELSEMSEEEMAAAMERISDYTADCIVRIMRNEFARGR